MQDLQDYSEDYDKPKTNYQKWAFRMFIYYVITNIAVAYVVINDVSLFSINYNFFFLSILGLVCFLLGIIFIIVSIANKEKRNYQFYVVVIGFTIFMVILIIFAPNY